jgi:hypothetical protein
MRENRPSGSEGGAGDNPLFLPLSPRPEQLRFHHGAKSQLDSCRALGRHPVGPEGVSLLPVAPQRNFVRKHLARLSPA